MAVAVFSVLTLNGCVPKAPSAVQAPQSTIPQAAPEMEPETRGGPHLQGTSSPVTLPTVQPTQCSLLAASPLEMLSTPIASYEIVNAYPHDPLAFTQGLLFADGFLYESTGLYGQSTVRQVNLETGEVVRETHLSPDLFGEGLTLHDGRLIQLTWQSRIGLVYNLVSFDTMSPTTFTYPTEGWGLTTDGHLLIMSDGTATLRYLHPMTFNLVR